MKIARDEIPPLMQAVAQWVREGKITEEKCDAFLMWGLHAVEESAREDTVIDLPPEYIALYREFQKSKEYVPNPDSLLAQAEERENPTSKTVTSPIMKTNKNFLQSFVQLTGQTKSAFERIEFARRGGNETDLDRAVRRAFHYQAREQRHSCGDPVERVLADPQQRLFWNAIGKRLSAGRLNADEQRVMDQYEAVRKDLSVGLAPGDASSLPNSNLGSGLFPVPVSPDVWDLLLAFGAFSDLGVRTMESPYTKFANVTGLPTAVFLTPATQGTVQIPADSTLAGTSFFEASNTIATRVEVSMEWAQDAQLDVANSVLSRLSTGLASRLDWACFSGTGATDQQNGGQTGIFVDPSIQSYIAPAGETSINRLLRADFIGTIATVNPAVLQRFDSCRWFISPAILPSLMALTDGTGPRYLLQTPAETEGEWTLLGFPVTWASAAPASTAAGAKVAAFGESNAYLVAIRQMFELMMCDWMDGRFVRQVRALMRGKCQTRDASGFATLKLASA